MGLWQVLALMIRVDLGVMAIKGYSLLSRSLEREPHNQMKFSVIPRTLNFSFFDGAEGAPQHRTLPAYPQLHSFLFLQRFSFPWSLDGGFAFSIPQTLRLYKWFTMYNLLEDGNHSQTEKEICLILEVVISWRLSIFHWENNTPTDISTFLKMA